LDLANKNDLSTFLKDKSPDIIVHLAGKAGVRPSIEDPEGYIRANITATQNILDIMKEKGIRKMAFASSSSVYGNCPETPFRENMDVSNPVSPYAFTKKSCELINYTYHHLYQLDILNMRFFTVFGPRQRPDLAIHKFTRLLRNNEPIPMFGDGGTARDYTYVADTVAGIESAIDYLLKNENVYETVNLGNNHPVLLRDMIQTIAEEAGVKPVINQLPMQDGDVNITYADISRAKELLGYQPKTSFREGIKKFLMWYDEMHSA
jgi:nucleoside-diphosphate-sugar epimerase